MSKRFTIITLVAACLFAGAFLNTLIAGDASPNPWKALEKSYAEANVQLAQARLAQAKSQNQSVDGSVSQGMLDELQAGVQLTQDRLKQLESDSTADPYAPQIKAAEDGVNALQTDHEESLKANKLQADAVSDSELRREQAEITVAKARLAALKAVGQQSPEVRIQWELGQLQDQVRALWARPLIED